MIPLVYQTDYTVTNGGQSFLSPVQSGGGAGRPNQSYYRGSVRGMARGGKGLAQTFRSSGWHRGIYPDLLIFFPSHFFWLLTTSTFPPSFCYVSIQDVGWDSIASLQKLCLKQIFLKFT